MIINLFRNFGFTRSESILIIIFFILFIAGLIIPVILKKDLPSFDYSLSDMKYEKSVSDAIKGLNDIPDNNLSNEKFEKFISSKDNIESFFENQKNKSNGKLITDKININLAFEKDFEQLPGIGPVIAERIVSFREKTGKFRKIEEIMEIKGIGQKKFDAIKNYLTIE